jgi:tRNA pseudouridine13 synthase
LEAYGARAGRRALRVRLRDLGWRWLDDGSLELAFGLPPGAYATAALRELADTGEEPEEEGEAEE